MYVPGSISQTKDILKYLKEHHPKLKNLDERMLPKLLPVREEALTQDLIEFEKNQMVRKYKIGILNVRESQTTENEMFSNGKFLQK